jgi:hypothetical protein
VTRCDYCQRTVRFFNQLSVVRFWIGFVRFFLNLDFTIEKLRIYRLLNKIIFDFFFTKFKKNLEFFSRKIRIFGIHSGFDKILSICTILLNNYWNFAIFLNVRFFFENVRFFLKNPLATLSIIYDYSFKNSFLLRIDKDALSNHCWPNNKMNFEVNKKVRIKFLIWILSLQQVPSHRFCDF